MTIRLKLLCVIIKIILCTTLFAFNQNNAISFETLGIKEGLSQSSIFCIKQDSQGFMWFGTEDGLNKYNGYTFQIYRNDPQDPYSISYNYIRDICENYGKDKAELWIATYGGGLNRFDIEKEKFFHYKHNPKQANSLSSNFVLSLCRDNLGNIWIGTEKGLNRFNSETGNFICYTHDSQKKSGLSDDYINAILMDNSGVLWIGTNKGLNKVILSDTDHDSLKFICYKHNERDTKSISHNKITSIFEDQYGRLWIGTASGIINLYDRKNDNFIQYTNQKRESIRKNNYDVTAIGEDADGMIWVGTKGDGIDRFNPESKCFTSYRASSFNPESVSNNEIYSIYQDRSNILWVGTDVGLNKYNQEKKQFLFYQTNPHNVHSLSNNIVYSIIEDRSGILWIGTYGGGLNRFNPQTNQFIRFKSDLNNKQSISNNHIRAIYEDKSGVLWVGTYGSGLERLDPKKEVFYHFYHNQLNSISISSNYIRTICEDQYGSLWVGTDNGLNCCGRDRSGFTKFFNDPQDSTSLSSNLIYSIYCDRSGDLWVGTLKGLNKYNFHLENFIQYQSDTENSLSLSNNEVLCMFEDSKNRFWIGTPGGLNLFDRNKNIFIYYLIKDGLPNDLIYSIQEDSKGQLWLSTNRGLSCFDPDAEIFRNYDLKDGLQSNEFNIGASCKTGNGEMYFGGINGLNRFNPAEIKNNPYVPPIVFTDFQIFNKTVPIGEPFQGRIILNKAITNTSQINLSYKDRVISFEFAALHYGSPEKNCYSYKMENFDDHWNQVGTRRFATYTNLKPGRYIFKVRGSNSDGVWNPEETSIEINVKPPFWNTRIFKILIIIFFGLIIITIYKLRTYQIRKKNIELEKQVKRRTRALKKSNKALKKENKERKRIQKEREKLIQKLQYALDNVKTLKGMLPICARCKKVKDDTGYWQQVEEYVRDNSEAEFSHGLCPECMKKVYPDYDEEEKTSHK